jgi:uncharacterized protein YndB with AHSA1/START domain
VTDTPCTRALSSADIVNWWVRRGVFDTRQWSGTVEAGGTWESAGLVMGRPYSLHGEYLHVDPPGKLVHTYQRGDVPGDPPTTVSYSVEPVGNGTRITLRHSGFTSREVCLNNCLGWETSFAELAALLAPGATGDTAAGNAESSD